jgi:predicted nucleotidyltransferase
MRKASHTEMRTLDNAVVKAALTELQAGLQKLHGPGAPILLVYGSYARREAHFDSDIDVLLVYSSDIRPGEEIHRVSALLADLNLRYQVLVSVLPASEKQYQGGESGFWENIRREGKTIDAL